MVSALRHGFSGRRSHVGTAERGRYSVPRTKKRWHPTASPARDDMPKCCLFAAASSAYERHTNKVNSRVDDFTVAVARRFYAIVEISADAESLRPRRPGLGLPPENRIARLSRQALSTSYFSPL